MCKALDAMHGKEQAPNKCYALSILPHRIKITSTIYRYQKNISCKDGHNKAQNGKDLTEAGEIKKRWHEYTEELYKKVLNDPDNHHGVITHLEPDILGCEIKWALGSITMNKASKSDGIPAELFQILKDDAVKVLHSICHKFGKLSSGHKAGKSQFSFQSQRRTIPNNVQITTQLHSFHIQ